MCLEIIASISPDAPGRISAGRLSEIAGVAITSRKMKGHTALHFAVTGGCSCEFLSDDAAFESETWALSPAHLPALASAVSSLAKECRKFSFIAHWLDGERPRRDERISGAALVKLIAENQVGNNVLYVVG
ncbi:MAG TPA: hypothetical protein VH105_13075 [Burkholderiales bacterium]|nr:hypothetical protein [Burkholderiales bacterium]